MLLHRCTQMSKSPFHLYVDNTYISSRLENLLSHDQSWHVHTLPLKHIVGLWVNAIITIFANFR
jgi:hypothetical protein